MSLIQWTHFPPLGDDRGSLVALEGEKTVPFTIQRVYYLFGTKLGVSRGFHAHKKLQQVAVCVTGRCRMVLDDGQKREEVWLDSPTQGLLISNMVWRKCTTSAQIVYCWYWRVSITMRQITFAVMKNF